MRAFPKAMCGLAWEADSLEVSNGGEIRAHAQASFLRCPPDAPERCWVEVETKDQLHGDAGLGDRRGHGRRGTKPAWSFLLGEPKPPPEGEAERMLPMGTGEDSLWTGRKWKNNTFCPGRDAGNCWAHDPIYHTRRKAGNSSLNKIHQRHKAEIGCKRRKARMDREPHPLDSGTQGRLEMKAGRELCKPVVNRMPSWKHQGKNRNCVWNSRSSQTIYQKWSQNKDC